MLRNEYQYFAPDCPRDCQLMTYKSQSDIHMDCLTEKVKNSDEFFRLSLLRTEEISIFYTYSYFNV